MRMLKEKVTAESFYLGVYTQDSWKDLVDNFWETSTKRKEYENIQDNLRTRLDHIVSENKLPPDETWELNGHRHKVTVSKEREARSFRTDKDIKKIHKLLGDKFYDIIKVSMSELENALTGDQLEKYTVKSYTGVRSFSPTREK